MAAIKIKIGALIPAYNEEREIAWVVERTLPFVQEVLVVNDGSKDNTAGIIKKAILALLISEGCYNQRKGIRGSESRRLSCKIARRG